MLRCFLTLVLYYGFTSNLPALTVNQFSLSSINHRYRFIINSGRVLLLFTFNTLFFLLYTVYIVREYCETHGKEIKIKIKPTNHEKSDLNYAAVSRISSKLSYYRSTTGYGQLYLAFVSFDK